MSGSPSDRSGQVVVARQRLPHRFTPRPFAPPIAGRLRGVLATEHARTPFSQSDVRASAHRVLRLAEKLTLEAILVRGGLDIGGAEVDHLWAVVDGRVVDVGFPLHSEAFVEVLRAYVAGDVDDEGLEFAAHAYSLEWRVVGEFPERFRYVGTPVWSGRRARTN